MNCFVGGDKDFKFYFEFNWWHGGAVFSTVSSQQEGPGFQSGSISVKSCTNTSIAVNPSTDAVKRSFVKFTRAVSVL